MSGARDDRKEAPASPPASRLLSAEETFDGTLITLRLVRLDDCTPRYLAWLQDPHVNRYLETRWTIQTLDAVRRFVEDMSSSAANYLFAILDRSSVRHVGNIKLGPINPHHRFADVSYFIGDRECWGRGYATDAIRTVSAIGFERLGLNRLQAGVYRANRSSARALEKAGYRLEGTFRQQLMSDGRWDDHMWYGLLRTEWRDGRTVGAG